MCGWLLCVVCSGRSEIRCGGGEWGIHGVVGVCCVLCVLEVVGGRSGCGEWGWLLCAVGVIVVVVGCRREQQKEQPTFRRRFCTQCCLGSCCTLQADVSIFPTQVWCTPSRRAYWGQMSSALTERIPANSPLMQYNQNKMIVRFLGFSVLRTSTVNRFVTVRT